MNPNISKILTTLALVLTLSLGAIAQPPPPDQHGSDENEPSAPVGSGLLILLAMGAAYGAKKVYDARKRLN